jgi:hypothetical protein
MSLIHFDEFKLDTKIYFTKIQLCFIYGTYNMVCITLFTYISFEMVGLKYLENLVYERFVF